MTRVAPFALALLLTACTTVGLRDNQTLAIVDFGEPTVLRLCVLAETGIAPNTAVALIRDAWQEAGADFGIILEPYVLGPWVRNGYTVSGLGAQLLRHPLPEQCDRLFAFVGRTFGDIVWGFTGLPEVLGWVNDSTRTHGYIVAQWGTFNQIFMPPTDVLRHELLHALGCEHAVTQASCYRQIARLKRARVGEFFPAWDAEWGRVLPTRRAVAARLQP